MPLAVAILLIVPAVTTAQTKDIDDAIKARLAAIRYVLALQTPSGGFAPVKPEGDAKLVPSLRATSGAVRALKYLHGKPAKDVVPNADTTAAFVMSCFDPKTGGFSDAPGGKPDVFLTSVGVMAAVELGIPRDRFRKALDYIETNAMSFEDMRIGAAAVEAWGVKDCPFKLDGWFKALELLTSQGKEPPPDQDADSVRWVGSTTAMLLRLGKDLHPSGRSTIVKLLTEGQRADGGYGKAKATSDLETTYRVLRALYLLKEKPKSVKLLREFVAKCRNADGGYGTKPGEKSSVGGVYYATMITKWLDEMEAK